MVVLSLVTKRDENEVNFSLIILRAPSLHTEKVSQKITLFQKWIHSEIEMLVPTQ